MFQMPQDFAIKFSTDIKCEKHFACVNASSTWQASEILTFQQWVKYGGVWLFQGYVSIR